MEELGLSASSKARVGAAHDAATEQDLTEQQKRDNVVRLAFAGSDEQFVAFVHAIRDAVPRADQ